MEPKVNYVIVGTFVITLTAIFILAIVWLSSGLSLEKYDTYLLYMQESVSGLSVDSQVEFNGVEVGKVKSVELNHKNPQLVEVLLDVKHSTPVSKGTVATLTTRGLTGLVYIALKDKGLNQQKLEAAPGQAYPVITTSPSIFLRLDAALTRFSNNFQKIAESFQTLLDAENLASIKSSLENIKEITATLSDNSHRFNRIIKNVENSTQRLSPLMQSTTGAMRTLEIETLPAASDMFSRLNDVANNLADVSLAIKQDPSILIRGVHYQNLGPGETK